MLVPKLRFKREDGTDYPEWKKKTISELFEISAGGDIDKANSTKEYSKDYPYAVYANTLTNKGLYGYANYYKVERDCFTVTGRGDVGYAVARHEKFVPIVRLLVCIPKHNENVDFFAEIVNYTNILIESTGVPQLTSIQLGKIKVNYPTDIEEQQKIADFLSTVDEVIAQSEAEVQNLEQQKKAAMQKIFSQEVRFKREDGTDYPVWEKRKFVDIYDEASEGATPSTSIKEYYENGTIPFVKIEDTVNKYIYNVKSFITQEGLDNCSAWLIPENSVIFTNGATIGNVSINKIPVATKQGILGIVPKQFLLYEYLYYWLSTSIFINEVHKRETKGTFATIILKSLNEIAVYIPCLEEQQKIADFLSAYDEAISYAKQELEHWKQLKKGLLQQMFV